jgi:hypothetical protein
VVGVVAIFMVIVLGAFLLVGGGVAFVGYRAKSNPLLITGLVFVAAAAAFIAFNLFLLIVCLAGAGCI